MSLEPSRLCLPELRGMNALVLDEEPLLLDLLTHWLRSCGTLCCGFRHLSRVRRACRHQRFDLALIAIPANTPEVHELLDAFRHSPSMRPTRILGLCTNISPAYELQRRYDLDAVLPKPFNLMDLSTALATMLRTTTTAGQPTAQCLTAP